MELSDKCAHLCDLSGLDSVMEGQRLDNVQTNMSMKHGVAQALQSLELPSREKLNSIQSFCIGFLYRVSF